MGVPLLGIDRFEKSVYDVIGRQPFGLGSEIGDQPVTQYRLGDGLNVF